MMRQARLKIFISAASSGKFNFLRTLLLSRLEVAWPPTFEA